MLYDQYTGNDGYLSNHISVSTQTDYIVEYTDAENFRDPSTVWERMTIPGTQLSAVIDDLTADQEYHARVTAQISSSEIGPLMASPATFTTPVIPPSRRFTISLYFDFHPLRFPKYHVKFLKKGKSYQSYNFSLRAFTHVHNR